jgi:sugar O-acyltransferase (sialic acid O-acetyltransferase NeuD family)
MLIIGAKGFAKEVLEVLHQNNQIENIAFYDDISKDLPKLMYNEFSILNSKAEAELFFKQKEDKFTLGTGNPILRNKMYLKFTKIGGSITSSISPFVKIGHYGTKIGEGCNIMTGTIITNDVLIGKGVLINLNCTIGHDTIIEDFVELSPGVNISGNCYIGKHTNIGTNAIILPQIKIGSNVIIGAGSVVNKDIPDNSVVVGVPAKIIKQNNIIEFNE